MENANRYRRKTHINEPLLILFVFTKDQVIPLFAAVAIGMITKQTFILVCAALVYIYISKKQKTRYPKGHTKHRMWSAGFILTKPSRSIADPIKRTYYK